MPSALDKLEALHEPPRSAGGPPRGRGGIIGGALATLGLLAAKGKALLVVLANLKLWMFWKTAATMLLAISIYAGSMGWPLAAALVTLILVHECGHVWAAHRTGVPVSAPMFIPFVGAFIQLRGKPRSSYDEFVIAAGGPLLGGLGALACLALGNVVADGAVLRVAGWYGIVLNVFNLTPFWILDGKKMLLPVRPKAVLAGAIYAALVLIATAAVGGHLNPIGLIAAALCLWRGAMGMRRARQPATALEQLTAETVAPGDDATPEQQRNAAFLYFALLAGLGGAANLLAPAMP